HKERHGGGQCETGQDEADAGKLAHSRRKPFMHSAASCYRGAALISQDTRRLKTSIESHSRQPVTRNGVTRRCWRRPLRACVVPRRRPSATTRPRTDTRRAAG